MGVLNFAIKCSWTGLLLLAAAAPLPAGEPAAAVSSPYEEYEVKAAMLYNFAKFIDWPAAALGEAGAPFVIGILGSDPFGARLDAVLRDKAVNGHPIAVRRFALPADVRNCQVLFVSAPDQERVRHILQGFRRAPVLTVGEGGRFADSGGVISFILDDRRVRFEINVDAASRAGLLVSSKLLRLATVRRDGGGQARN